MWFVPAGVAGVAVAAATVAVADSSSRKVRPTQISTVTPARLKD